MHKDPASFLSDAESVKTSIFVLLYSQHTKGGIKMYKLGHIGINAVDIEESIAFYTDVLQCKVIEDRIHPGMRLVFMDAGGATIELVYKEGNRELPDGPVSHIAFNVENLEDEIYLLKEKGLCLLGDPRTVGKSRIVFFKGPNGEKIEFVEQL